MTPLLTPLGLCLIVVTLCYFAVCTVSPWGTCARCRGRSRTCRKCDGTGIRPRLAWQAYASLRRAWKNRT